MTTRSLRCCSRSGGAALASAAMLAGGALAQSRPEVLYSFEGSPDAEYPSTDLVVDGGGNLYGMTVLGGTYGSGTVFRLAFVEGNWVESVLYSFTSTVDGGQPYGGVTLDTKGNLYGTAVVGGSGGACPEDGCGVVWQLTRAGDHWTHRVIHNFSGLEDGYGPGGPVVFDDLGNLYGMTPTGGAYGLGVIYQLAPDEGGDWTLNVIHAFTGGEDGGTGSAGRLLIDDQRNIYGVATVGGAHGVGTIFRLTPAERGPWTMTTLYAFQGEPDGVFPYGGLARDPSGNFYGTTYYGGAHGFGTVYKLAEVNGAWVETVLHSFRDGIDGSYPIGHVVLDSAGRLYGATSEGGAPGCSCGIIFRLSQDSSGAWKERIVHRFQSYPDGAFAYSGLAVDAAGNMYGATVYGGLDGEGAIYKFTP